MRMLCFISAVITAAVLLLPSLAASQEVEPPDSAVAAYQWRPLELTFTAQRDYDAPFDFESVRLVATFEREYR